MKRTTFSIIAVMFVAIAALAATLAQSWAISDNYAVKFSTPKADGIFKKLSGDINFDPANLAGSRFNVQVDVGSINTGNGMKNNHAKGADYLNYAKYPNITFTSSAITAKGSAYDVKGTLDMHGVKKEISFPFTFQSNTFKGGFQVRCKDFGLNEMGNGDEDIVKIDLTVPVSKKQTN